MLKVATKIIINQNETKKMAVALSLLEELAYYSHTTEIPNDLKLEWDNISRKVFEIANEECTPIWENICIWYRMKG